MNIPGVNSLRKKIWQWVDSRRPTSATQTLNRDNLFIFPSRQGFWFLLVDLLLWLLGTNYQNNLVLALAFLLITLLIVAILHTFANLSGLTIKVLGSDPVFCGETADLKILVTNESNRFRDSLSLKWEDSESSECCLAENTESTVSTYVKTHHRGWIDPGRLIVDTVYPLGIVRSWTRLKTGCRILVYPQPISVGPLPLSASVSDEGVVAVGIGSDEFSGYKNYQPGDSLKNVSWKTYARGMGFVSKEYSAYRDQRLWLEWDFLTGKNTEQRLSGLCYWALEANKKEKEFGLRIPGIEIEPASGRQHLHEILQALALHGVRDASFSNRDSYKFLSVNKELTRNEIENKNLQQPRMPR